ncbi:MAG: hypothetical protein HWQ23_12195 [Nostoc sp. JL33]|uniref:hypothetical protein n=1 Tax=Nostoc sp. JL33 TaxID=2815396 RepID=UPI0025CDBD98|nr:hypothetical protein [Nostoc sp. JL33]MBN3871003.1 hypothetical protein [Nostoc sp. JL33]
MSPTGYAYAKPRHPGFDLAGFPLAICQKPEKWQSDFLNTYDFMLDAENRFVSSKIYV